MRDYDRPEMSRLLGKHNSKVKETLAGMIAASIAGKEGLVPWMLAFYSGDLQVRRGYLGGPPVTAAP